MDATHASGICVPHLGGAEEAVGALQADYLYVAGDYKGGEEHTECAVKATEGCGESYFVAVKVASQRLKDTHACTMTMTLTKTASGMHTFLEHESHEYHECTHRCAGVGLPDEFIISRKDAKDAKIYCVKVCVNNFVVELRLHSQ